MVKVIIDKGNRDIIQINFYSGDERLVAVGEKDYDVKPYIGRIEVFRIAEDEQLIGCKLLDRNRQQD